MEQNYHCTEKEVPYYYRIGMFAQMNKITIKALRHYDEIGLLKPAYVDSITDIAITVLVNCQSYIVFSFYVKLVFVWMKFNKY